RGAASLFPSPRLRQSWPASMTASAADTVCPVMVFAKAPGEAKTRLIPALGAAGAGALHRRLVMHCLRAARDSRLGPVELWCAPDTSDPFFRECERRLGISLWAQGEGDLGARMQRAFESALVHAARAILIGRSEEHTSELQSLRHLVCRLLLE